MRSVVMPPEMEPYGASRSEVREGKPLKEMVGTRRLELLTSTVSIRPQLSQCQWAPSTGASSTPASFIVKPISALLHFVQNGCPSRNSYQTSASLPVIAFLLHLDRLSRARDLAFHDPE